MIANPIYGGAYAYGTSRSVPGYHGRSGIRRKARDEWLALIPDAHEGLHQLETGGGDPQDGQRQCTGQSPSWSAEAWRRSACRPVPLQKVRPEADGSLHRSQP
ncbi:recombinase family protein [Ensifer sp. ENS01]|uniref:recombinase family protein n=1 Tax=Ensifer sp. ENS01 TaxID=2769293 RepID=UPI001FEE0A6E|nr:recombinase family protein [Ensifer sp. ENS01]